MNSIAGDGKSHFISTQKWGLDYFLVIAIDESFTKLQAINRLRSFDAEPVDVAKNDEEVDGVMEDHGYWMVDIDVIKAAGVELVNNVELMEECIFSEEQTG